MSRWRKKRDRVPQNVLVISPQLIRSVINDNLDLQIPESLYEYVYEVDDYTLMMLGEQILDDHELWLTLTEVIVAYVTSLKFTEVMEEGGFDED